MSKSNNKPLNERPRSLDHYSLHFYSFSQDEYLTAVAQWVKSFGFEMNEYVQEEALRWATEHGSRSGRIALQFARDYAGRTLLEKEKQ